MIEIRGVSKAYSGRTVLHTTDLVVAGGTVVCVFGPNGSGKSTLLQITAGVTPPDAGEVRIDAVDLRRSPHAARSRLGFMPQGGGLYERLTVTRHIELELSLRSRTGASAKERVARLFDGLGLRDLVDEPAANLSGGMRQMLALCRALCAWPAAALLDEPTAGLDGSHRDNVWRAVRELAEDGSAVLVSSHDVDDVAECDAVVCMSSGVVVAAVPVEALHQDGLGRKKACLPRAVRRTDAVAALKCPSVLAASFQGGCVSVWVKGSASLDAVSAELNEHGVDTAGIRHEEPTLEDRLRHVMERGSVDPTRRDHG